MRGALQTLTLLALLGGAQTKFSIPLRISPALVSQPQPVSTTTAKDIMGLALASDPSGNINFMTMVNNLEGDSGRGYYLEMMIGTPPQALNILVDTGSSNFAVAGAPNPDISKYFDSEASSTYQSLGLEVTVRYTQGSWTGVLGKDVISVPKGVNGTFLVNIASILESESFFMPQIKWQGILGMAYSTLAKPSSSVETFFDSLVKQANIPNIFSMQMCGAGLPTTGAGVNGGSLVMGGIEPVLYTGDIWYTPITEEWYYQVEVLKFEVGGMNLNLDCREVRDLIKMCPIPSSSVETFFDSLVEQANIPNIFSMQMCGAGLPTTGAGVNGGSLFNAEFFCLDFLSFTKCCFSRLNSNLSVLQIQNFNTEFWTGLQLACWEKTEEPWLYFPDLSIYLRDSDNASRSFRLTMKPQLYIQSVMTFREDMNCYRFGISPSSNALVIGATVMEGFYTIFDREEKRVGFAVSSCAEVNNVRVSEISGPFTATDVSSNCIASNPLREPIMWIISYSLMTFCGIVLLVLVVLLLLPNRRHNDNPEVVNDESSLVRHRWK
ncbi:beta-secretase 2 [Pyxicephalus adspersus]|uniref:beta-secretase 2 n=1 Tax=Pyxicephalus adspersus TaxID=30357 RepID=UPI003B58F2C6